MRELYLKRFMQGTLSQSRWFALTVRHQHERQVKQVLQFKGFESLVPVYRSQRAWSDRTMELELPLFAGYVLCRFGLTEKARVLGSPGVIKIVGFGGLPAPIDDREIDEIQTAAASGLLLRPWPFLKAGDRVRVERGPLRGVEGRLLVEKGRHRLVIGVEILNRAIAVEIEPGMVSPLRSAAAGV